MGMTREEAIKALSARLISDDVLYVDDISYPQALAFAIDALEAQEPMKPTIDIRHGKSMWRCGSCATALQPNQIHTKFCFNCGRAVQWSD